LVQESPHEAAEEFTAIDLVAATPKRTVRQITYVRTLEEGGGLDLVSWFLRRPVNQIRKGATAEPESTKAPGDVVQIDAGTI
jgi:hypothetical protein